MDVKDTVTPEEETQELEESPEADVLDMSDESFDQMMSGEPVNTAADSEDENDPDATDEDTGPEEGTTPEMQTQDEDTETENPADPDTETESPATEEPATEQADTEGKTPDPVEIDYKAQYEKILAPFKANGRDIKVESIDDALQLMQMGANYNKKMAALKPGLKALKALEQNNLLDDEKLNYLIDLSKKNPDAIAKLMKDAEMDPLDVDTTKANSYVPTDHRPSDTDLAIDSVIDRISGNESFGRTMKVITEEMDGSSRAMLSQNPDVIAALDLHIQNGIYDQIMGVVDRERMLGRLNGVSDLEAYKAVGDRLHSEGAFTQASKSEGTPEVTEPIRKKADPKKVAQKKKAAASVKSKPARKQPEYDPLSMSDEDFEKLTMNQLYS